METQPVNSEAISRVGYDRATQTLVVHFKHGGQHAFYGVPAHEHQAFLTAPSIGKHFHKHIRGNSNYRSEKLK